MLFPWLWLRSTGFPFRWLDELAMVDPECDDPERFAREVVEVRRALIRRVCDPAVTGALVLSNAEAVDRVAALAACDPGKVNLRVRQRLRLAWSYLQRFCAKNETCSFFGPLAWGRVDPDAAEDIATWPVDPAAGRLLRRSVRVEHWVVRALCAAASGDAPYRLHPGCDLDGDDLRVPVGKRIALPGDVARYLRAIGTGAPVPPGARALVKAGVVRREVAVSPEDPRGPLRIEEAIGRPLPVVARLEELRARFERETGAAARRRLLAELSGVLEAEGVDTARAAGTMYAGRLPVYEDCERNLRVRVGGGLARALAEQLPPLLRLHRLVAECAASALHDHYAAVAGGLLARDGATEADFPEFLRAARAEDVITGVRAGVEARVRSALDEAWAAFGWPPEAEEVVLDDGHLDAVAGALRARFPDHARFGGVLGVGVMSPDVLVAAPRSGRWAIVLGEVHPCVLAALQPVALPFLDGAERALAAADALLGGSRTVLAPTDAAYQRSQFTWPATASLAEVVLPGATSRCPPERTIPAGRGRVRVVDGLVRFVDRGTGRTEDMVSLLSSDLQRVAFGLAGSVLGGETRARLRYRAVVARRRSWAPDPATLPAAPRPAEDFADYRALRDWARARGLPRRGFFRVDTEPKPVYLDWAGPLAVDAFAKAVRGATRLRITELSPGPDELWLADDLGAHTAELRTTYLV